MTDDERLGWCAIDLAGAGWTLVPGASSAASRPELPAAIPAEVPGCVHTELVRAGLIERLERTGDGPHVDWIGRTAWTWRRAFAVDERSAAAPDLELVFDGLQGVCDVVLDGRVLGRAENQFRTWRFDVAGVGEGEHELELRFADTMAWLAERDAERQLPGWGVGQDKDATGAWLRVSPVVFGWDFAPRAVTCGPWKGARLEALERARLDDVRAEQEHRADGSVVVSVRVALRAVIDEPLRVGARLGRLGEFADDSATTRGADAVELRLVVAVPELWWPNGEGEQPLYDLEVRLAREGGETLDRRALSIGLRTIELVREPDAHGESFLFRGNGRDVAIRGANVVPPRLFDAEVGPEDEDEVLWECWRAKLNMVRVWGGGPYASEAFYDLCDRYGLLVWQDLPFACCTYPTFDDAFLANVEEELREQCRRLHHRASLALLCGNNELENGLCADEWTDQRMSWRDYARLFDELAPRVVAEEAPGVAWWPGSPHTPVGDRANFNDLRSGDAHLWDVWHGEKPFEHFLLSRHRFVSEFGFQAPSEPTVVRDEVGGDLTPANPAVRRRQRSKDGDARVDRYLAREGIDAATLDPVRRAHLARIVQARGMQLAMEHFRRGWPRCGGFLLWQLNQPWFGDSWAALDGPHSSRPLQFVLGRAAEPRLLSLELDAASGARKLRGHLTCNDPEILEREPARIRWRSSVARIDGAYGGPERPLEGEVTEVTGTTRLFEVDLASWLDDHGLAPEEAVVELAVSGDAPYWSAELVPAPLGRWRIRDPKSRVVNCERIEGVDDATYVVEFECEGPAWYPTVFHERFAVETPFVDEPRVESDDVAGIAVFARGAKDAADLLDGLRILTLHDLLGRA
ncbi:MAG: hypothetical protein R3F34_07495 [Planctomycetota bacterium]